MKFRMVDRICDWAPRRTIRGLKAVSFEEYSWGRIFEGEPVLPASLMIEALFQLGNWLVMLSTDFQRMGLILRIGSIRLPGRVRPGQVLDMRVDVRSWRPDGVLFDGRATVEGAEAIAGEGCLATPVVLADYCDGDDLRVLFSEIHRPSDAEAAP